MNSNNPHVHEYDDHWKCKVQGCGYLLPEELRRDKTLGKTDVIV